MAEFKGVNSTIVDGTTGVRVQVADVGGRVRTFHEEFTTASGTHATGSTIMFGVLPKGARIIGLLVTASATLGATGTISWGTRATAAGSTLDLDAIAAAAKHEVTVPTWIGTSATTAAGVAMGEKLAAESYIIGSWETGQIADGVKLIVDTFYQLD